MSDPDLTAADISYLSDCRLIASENYAFYEKMYDMITPHVDKDILGRVMAQKKDFIDAVTMLVSSFGQTTSISGPRTQELVLSLPANDVKPGSNQDLNAMINLHETRFDKAMRLTLEQVKDEMTLEVLKHHRDAATIANLAMTESE